MKITSVISVALVLAFSIIGSAAAMTDEERASMQLMQDPSPDIARRVSVGGRLYWTSENKSLYPTWSGSSPPSSHCLPVLIGNGDDTNLRKAEEMNGKDVEIYGIISFTAEKASMISVRTCKQLGIYVISIDELKSK